MRMRTGLLAVGAACAACCAPLLVPVFAGVGLTGAGVAGGALLLGLTLDQVLCFGLPVAALIAGGGLWWFRRVRARRNACRCKARCGVEGVCAPEP